MAQEENRPCPHFLPPQDSRCAAQAEDAYQRELLRYKRELSREGAQERGMSKLIGFGISILVGLVFLTVYVVRVIARAKDEGRRT